ncbi:MAG: FtsQ-type POTRA domain-containing protein [Magnetococcales bacterium]|nr:FtsQ-type POTRA domain-containing protein [Magnetococcales bacterium]
MLRKTVTLTAVVLATVTIYFGWVEAAKPGYFPLEEIRLEGVVNSDVEQTLDTINIDKGANLLSIDLDSVKKNLLSLPWIRSVRVKRVFPNTLSVNLTEKIAVCMGKDENRLHLLDEYGTYIKLLEAEDPLIFPVVITPERSRNKQAKIVWLINLLGRHPWIKERISEAVGFAGNRWVLYTKKGVKLLLSADADNELELLMRLQKRYDILNRQVRQIELRIPGRIAVRMYNRETEVAL